MSDNEVFICDDCMEDFDPLYPCLFRNYIKISKLVLPYADRCYEGCTPLYLVFKPFDRNYDPSVNEMEHIRKYLQSKQDIRLLIMTREIIATKVHYNVFMWVYNDDAHLKRNHPDYQDPCLIFHEKHTSKFMIHCDSLDTLCDRYQVLEYMIKESTMRRFNQPQDLRIIERA